MTRHMKLVVCLIAMLSAEVAFSQVASTEGNGGVRGGLSSSPVAYVYPPSGVKLRPSERGYKPYIVVLLVRYRLDNFPADLLFVI
jgi:hypothetical protein